MAGIGDIYTTALYKNFKPLYANWEPDVPLKLGTYGLLRGRTFIRLGEFDNAALLKEVANLKKSQKSFFTKGGTQVTFHAGGGGATGGVTAKASLEIGFSREDAVFFNAAGCTFHSVANKVALGKELYKRYNAGKWEWDWVMVTDLIRSEATTIVVTGASDGKIVLEATGEVPKIDLADASLRLTARSYTNVGYQTVSKEGLVPLVGLSKLQWHVFRPDDFGPLAAPPPDALATGEGGTTAHFAQV